MSNKTVIKLFKLMKRGQDKELASDLHTSGLTRVHSDAMKFKLSNSEYQVEFGKEDLDVLRRAVRQLEQLK